MLKQSANIYSFAIKLLLLAGLLLCVEALMTDMSVFGGIGLVLEVTHPRMMMMIMKSLERIML